MTLAITGPSGLSDVNAALVAVVAVATLVLGIFQRSAASRARALEKAIEQRKEVSDLTYVTKDDFAQMAIRIDSRLTALETALRLLRPGGDGEDPG